MFNDISPGVGPEFDRDVTLSSLMMKLAKRKFKPTDDVHAAFKEGERAPVAGAQPA